MPGVALAAERFPVMSRKPVHIRSWHLEKTPKQFSVLQQTFHYPPDRVCKILRPIEVEAMATWDDHNLCVELLGQQVRDLLVDGQSFIGEHQRNRHVEVSEVFGLGFPTRKARTFDRRESCRHYRAFARAFRLGWPRALHRHLGSA